MHHEKFTEINSFHARKSATTGNRLSYFCLLTLRLIGVRALFPHIPSSRMLRPSFLILSVIKYRVHNYFILFNCVKYREWEPPYWAASKTPISNLVHFWIDDNVLNGCLDTIKKIKTKAPTLPFIPGKGQFQIIS